MIFKHSDRRQGQPVEEGGGQGRAPTGLGLGVSSVGAPRLTVASLPYTLRPVLLALRRLLADGKLSCGVSHCSPQEDGLTCLVS